MTIYEIDSAIESAIALYEQGISEVVDTETGEVKTLQEYIDELQLTKEEKIKNLALFVKNRTAFINALKDEKKRVSEQITKEEKRIDSAIEYLKLVTDGKKIEDPQFIISYRKSKSVEISEGADIPPEFLVPQEPKVSKTELKKALENGAVIKGVELIEKNNMSVK